jgi:hypothetical protein
MSSLIEAKIPKLELAKSPTPNDPILTDRATNESKVFKTIYF